MTSVHQNASKVNTGGFFLTQKGEKMAEVKREIAELEALLAGATQTSQSTLLLKKRKEMREVDEALELMKEEFKNRMEACEERRMQFELKQAKMREQVLKFEKFIQENDAKRQRAEAKAKQERKTYEQKCQEMNTLLSKIEDMENAQKDLEKQLQKKACYRIYLEQFLDAGDVSYEEVSDILSRYDTLKGANRDLMVHVDSLENGVNELRAKLQSLKMETQNHLLVSNSLFQRNQKELEETRARTKKEEKEKELHEDQAKNIARETSQVVQSIKNVFARCQATVRNRNQVAVVNKECTLSELLSFNLDIIHARMMDLIEISSEYKAYKASNELNLNGIDLREGSGLTAGTGLAGGQTTNATTGSQYGFGDKANAVRPMSVSNKSTTS
mmetsp:Transcript_16541/g.24879  ORF Transcript_16541/g.24879 Transcript_16541/m.24879 type:complete len:387 (+) Transcript_16541:124-1284(+)|eukprot:CAMPEP_0185027242 /NCGR_PEP_ID=MMETSP1103-20130426/12046_1 /TAXON_ID=36769 /ORGANISM="Paraphysomonas bandaiensis, Strain Caron Lab Isolate" /LENGTH=386 /DNA_ID=CAMNT_0027561137 /DNA_START=36 /DNA_END=1196 /DNA_ORIENTATION=+